MTRDAFYSMIRQSAWGKGTQIWHGYRLDLKSNYGRNTVPYTARDNYTGTTLVRLLLFRITTTKG